jgi:hypothetical protein
MLMPVVLYALQTVAVVGGIIVCYSALFLYEDEQADVQNALEVWWIRLEDLRKDAVSWHAAFLKTAGDVADVWLARLFGHRILSSRAYAASLLLSLASAHFAGTLITIVAGLAIPIPNNQTGFLAHTRDWWIVFADVVTPFAVHSWVMHFVGAVAIVVVVWAAIEPTRRSVLFAGAALAMIAYGISVFLGPRNVDTFGDPDIILITLAIGVACDVVGISTLRWLIRWQTRSVSVVRACFAATLELVLACALLLVPFVVGSSMLGPSVQAVFGEGLRLAPLTNFLCAALCVSFFAAAVALLTHRILWPAINRPLYQLARLHVFRDKATRGALLSLGIATISSGSGHAAAVWDLLCQLFRSA